MRCLSVRPFATAAKPLPKIPFHAIPPKPIISAKSSPKASSTLLFEAGNNWKQHYALLFCGIGGLTYWYIKL